MDEQRPVSEGVRQDARSSTEQASGARPVGTQEKKTRKKRSTPWPFIGGAVVIILIALALWDPLDLLGSLKGSNTAVAMVNGETITQAEYDARTTQVRGSLGDSGVDLTQEGADEQVKNQVLQSLVTETLILQKANEEGATISNEVVDAEIEEIKGRFDSIDEYEAELDRNGFTARSFRKHVHDQLLIQSFLASRVDQSSITVTDEEVRAAYDEAVASTDSEDVPAFAQVQEQVRANLRQQKLNQAIAPIIQQLMEDADIEVLI